MSKDVEKKETNKKDQTIYEVLSVMQKTLKAPKNQYNSFGKYKYRSCEDILEGIKNILPEGYSITINDEIVNIGDRYYVKAMAVLHASAELSVCNIAYAREEESKKGMDGSQVTGAASSYARKYALNGLFAIDDTKDADSQEPEKQEPKKEVSKPAPKAEKSWEQVRANEIAVAIDNHKDLQTLEKMWEINAKDLDKINLASEKAHSALLAKYNAKRVELENREMDGSHE